MKKKQEPRFIQTAPGEFLALNRKTTRQLKARGIVHSRKEQTPIKHQNKAELKEFRKEIAKGVGSKTGKLKKKHFNRERIRTTTNSGDTK